MPASVTRLKRDHHFAASLKVCDSEILNFCQSETVSFNEAKRSYLLVLFLAAFFPNLYRATSWTAIGIKRRDIKIQRSSTAFSIHTGRPYQINMNWFSTEAQSKTSLLSAIGSEVGEIGRVIEVAEFYFVRRLKFVMVLSKIDVCFEVTGGVCITFIG